MRRELLGFADDFLDQKNGYVHNVSNSQGFVVICEPLVGPLSADTMHTHDFVSFLFFENGTGVYSVDFVNYPVKKHQVHILYPGQISQWLHYEDIKGYKLLVSKQIFETFFLTGALHSIQQNRCSVIDLDANAFLQLNNEVSLLRNEIEHLPFVQETVILRAQIVVLKIVQQIEQKIGKKIDAPYSSTIHNYLALIMQHFKQQKSVSFYAAKLRITSNYLNILCQKQLHISAASVIKNRIVLEAKRLMTNTNMSIKEIAFMLGFHSLSNFSSFFKSKTALSPKDYKKNIKINTKMTEDLKQGVFTCS